ncbi:MAG: hypothetical protein R2783_06700 [Gelidibacter sp.]
MKIKLLEYLKFGIFIFALILVNCQNENLEPNSNALGGTVKVQKISLNGFKNKSKVEDYLKKLKSRGEKKLLNRMVYDSINDFMVYTDEFTLVENGERDWLIFNVFRDFESDHLENLVLMNTNDGNYTSKLYQYDFNEEDILNIQNGNIVHDMFTKTTIIPLDTFDAGILYRDGGGYSYTVYVLPDGRCGVIDHIWEENGVIYVAFLTVECGSTGGGTYEYNGSDSGPNEHYSPGDWNGIFNNYLSNNHYYDAYGNGGSTTGNGPEGGFINLPDDPNDYYLDITIPIPTPQIDDNLAALSTITNNSRLPYKAKIAVLKTRLNDAVESGFEFRTTNSGGIAPPIAVSGNANGIQFPNIDIKTKVRMHVHTNSLDPVFSEKDVIGMAELFSVKDDLGATDAEDVTSLLVTPRGLYALRVDDPTKVISFNQDMTTGMDENFVSLKKKFYETYFKDVIREAQKECNGTCTSVEFLDLVAENFIKWLKAWDTGLSLYEGTENPDGSYTWEKK